MNKNNKKVSTKGIKTNLVVDSWSQDRRERIHVEEEMIQENFRCSSDDKYSSACTHRGFNFTVLHA